MKARNALRTWYLSQPASRKRWLRRFVVRSVLILALLILAVESYYTYRFYEESSATPGSNVARQASEPTNGAELQGEAAFVHRATPENISGNSTYLNSPLTNGDPNVLISVTQNWNPAGSQGIYNDHPVGVWYDPEARRWAIFNQDRAPIPEGSNFNVFVWTDDG